jgi:hypothetical protein
MAYLGSRVLAAKQWKMPDIRLVAILTTLATAFFIVLNGVWNTIYPIYPKSAYISRALHGQWNFLFPFRGSSGPFGFYISFSTIAWGFLLVTLFVVTYALMRKQTVRRVLLALIIGVGFAYNIVLIEEYHFSLINPNVNGVAHQIIDYAREHDLKNPVYSWNSLGETELQDKYKISNFGFSYQDDPETFMKIRAHNASVIFLDYGKLGEDTQLWHELHACKLEQSFIDKGVTLGYIFDCSVRTIS